MTFAIKVNGEMRTVDVDNDSNFIGAGRDGRSTDQAKAIAELAGVEKAFLLTISSELRGSAAALVCAHRKSWGGERRWKKMVNSVSTMAVDRNRAWTAA